MTTTAPTKTRWKGFKVLVIIAAILTALIAVFAVLALLLYQRTDGFNPDADTSKPVPAAVEQALGNYATHQLQSQQTAGGWDTEYQIASVDGLETCLIQEDALLITATDGTNHYYSAVIYANGVWSASPVRNAGESPQTTQACNHEELSPITEKSFFETLFGAFVDEKAVPTEPAM